MKVRTIMEKILSFSKITCRLAAYKNVCSRNRIKSIEIINVVSPMEKRNIEVLVSKLDKRK